jgi:hypothetical protein
MSGSIITTTFGGPYQVILTDLNGCRVQNSFMTPRSPADYLWVFPTGCFCHVPGSHPYLIGPIIPFSYWAWLKNSVVDVWGSGYMPNYTITPGNIYNMTLDNGFCQVSSGDMYYQSDTCNQLAGRPGAEASLQPGSRFAEAGGDYNALQLTPNPAAGQTTVRYHFAKGPGPRSITLIDMLGRSLQTYTLAHDSGRLVLYLAGLAAGMYRVVMRREGIVLQQSKLSLTR